MTKKNTVHSLRFRYVIGLSAIAILVTTSFLMMQQVISKQRYHSALINIAGHQAGLTNRIAYFSGLMAYTDDEEEYELARSQVGRTIHTMQHAHKTLREGDPAKKIPVVTNENLKTIYEDPMVGLDAAMINFFVEAEKIYKSDMDALSIKSTSYIFITTYGPHVLEPMLDAAVDEYEKIGEAAIFEIERLERGIWLATIIVLILELAFIFIPLESKVKNTLKSLEETISELTQIRKRLLSAQKLALVGDWELNVQTKTFTWSDQLYEIFGVAKTDEFIDWDTFSRFIHPEDHGILERITAEIIHTKHPARNEYRIIRPDGFERLVYQYATCKKGSDEDNIILSGTIQDITERKELSTRLEKLSEHVPGFIFQCQKSTEGEYKFSYASKGAKETCGISPKVIMRDSSYLFRLVHEEDIERLKFNLDESAKELTSWHAKFRINHPGKGSIWLEGHATPGRMVDGSVLWYGYIWDITERKKTEDHIENLALYDPLTGLANRRLMYDRLAHSLAGSDRNSQWGALVMLDLDNFKTLNDTHGHETGDALLVEVAKRITGATRESDTVARLGGDEFVAILEGVGKNRETAENNAFSTGEKIRLSLNEPYSLSGGAVKHRCGSSIGIALFQGNTIDESSLLKRADVAMYEAKEKGRNRVCLYSEQRLLEIENKNTLVQALQGAVQNNELSLYLQPQIDRTGRVSGAEALLRWFPAGCDPVSPAVFIPLAESCSLIIPLGDWVLEQACSHLKLLLERGVSEDFTLAVNISPQQFTDQSFLERTKMVIDHSGLKASHLKFEITESCLVHDFHYVKEILLELSKLGIRIELDDFGTGYSSLNSLYRLPIDGLKIDRSLVSNLEDATPSKDIIKAIIAMANSMSIEVIAEGVETQQQSDHLIREGVDYQQGFYFSQALPLENFIELFCHQEQAT